MGIFNSSFFSSLKKVTKVTNSLQTFEYPPFSFQSASVTVFAYN